MINENQKKQIFIEIENRDKMLEEKKKEITEIKK